MPTEFLDKPVGEGPASRYARYPVAADLSGFLEDAGFASISPGRLDLAIQSGIEDLEGKCQRHFLAGFAIDNTPVGPATRVYDPPTSGSFGVWGAALDLGPDGEIARIDSVVYSANSDNPQTWGPDNYRPMPANAAARGMAYSWLEVNNWWALPTPRMHWNTIAVTGLWGAGMRIPPDVWEAFLANGALILFSAQFRGAGVPIGIKSWTGPDGIRQEYDAAMLTSRLSSWQQTVKETIPLNGRWSWG